MNPAKCTESDYIQFLIATPWAYSCTEAARVSPQLQAPPAHNAFSQLLHRLEPNPNTLWQEIAPHVNPTGGVLVIDDSTLDKPYARKMGLVTWH